MQIHPLVTDTATLAALCDRLAAADFVTVDTEFMRENTYYPDLCLVQIAGGGEAAAVDPKASGLDLAPLLALMVASPVLKVFHAGGQDLEIIYNLTGGKTPYPLFDTQIAAMALGQGEQVSYTNLVQSYLGVAIDKGARFTDWARRPLSASQLDYAIGDVTHLAELFPRMLAKLMKTGRGVWLDEEMARLADPATYANDPELAWMRLRLPSRKPEMLGRLKAIAAWREREAQGKDVPRGRIVKDETLGDLAAQPPRTPGRSRQSPRAVGVMGVERHRRAADAGDRRSAAAARRRDAAARGGAAGAVDRGGTDRRPAQAAAQDPCQGSQCRAQADRPRR